MARRNGSWQNRVAYGPGGLAYRPHELLVREGIADLAAQILARIGREAGTIEYPEFEPEPVIGGTYRRLRGIPDPVAAIVELHRRGLRAQVNHVLFATCCCPPHPAGSTGAEFDPDPFYANPFYANPFYANPFYANAGTCCCSSAAAHPFYANPFYANPFYANANPASDPTIQATGRRESSARPAERPSVQPPILSADSTTPVVAILDTGYAGEYPPSVVPLRLDQTIAADDEPDGDTDGFLDPVAGHGTFIAGIIEQIAPGCVLEVYDHIAPYGDVDETEVGNRLWDLAERDEPLDLVNLSFGGYSQIGMEALARAVEAVQSAGAVVVASAGNDATCVPMFPAVLPDVVGVAALNRNGDPAPFTNYGDWVSACTLGSEVVSTFFDWNGAHPEEDGVDIDDFTGGWAVWSGTSFAAPRVVAALAQEMRLNNRTAQEAAEAIVNAISLDRKPMLGTVVLP